MQGKESISFSIVDEDDDFKFDEEILVENAKEIPSPKMARNHSSRFTVPQKGPDKLLNTDSEDEEELSINDEKPATARNLSRSLSQDSKNLSDSKSAQPPKNLPQNASFQSRAPSAGPSGRQPLNKRNSPPFPIRRDDLSSDSDSGDSEDKKIRPPLVGEYDPTMFEDLDVTEEIKDLFQYILKYTPQNLNLDYKFKPFVPDFIPAVGDIDAFLKVVPPDVSITGEPYSGNESNLGLTVLDEPASNQSDPALLHLQLRASSVNVSHTSNMVVKKVENVEKNSKVVEKWIKDISDLHRTKSSPVVKYSDPMPDLDDLMQEWPERMEQMLKAQGFPNYKIRGHLSEYIDIVCCIFDVPIYKNRIQSLHLLFSLFAAIKNSQLYKAVSTEKDNVEARVDNGKESGADQLVLD